MCWTVPLRALGVSHPGARGTLGSDRWRRAELVSLQSVPGLEREGYAPHFPEDWDDLAVDWAHVDSVTPSTLSPRIAALVFVLPAVEGKLVWARQRSDAAHRIAPPLHAAPAKLDVRVLLAVSWPVERFTSCS